MRWLVVLVHVKRNVSSLRVRFALVHAQVWVFPASEVKLIHVKGNGSSLQMNLGKGAQATSRAAPSAGALCHWCGCSLAEARSLVTVRGGGCVLRVSLPGVTPCTTPSHGSAVPRG